MKLWSKLLCKNYSKSSFPKQVNYVQFLFSSKKDQRNIIDLFQLNKKKLWSLLVMVQCKWIHRLWIQLNPLPNPSKFLIQQLKEQFVNSRKMAESKIKGAVCAVGNWRKKWKNRSYIRKLYRGGLLIVSKNGQCFVRINLVSRFLIIHWGISMFGIQSNTRRLSGCTASRFETLQVSMKNEKNSLRFFLE